VDGFDVTVTDALPWTIVAVNGDLDLATGPELVEVVSGLVPGTHMLLDLCRVPVVGSSVLSALTRARLAARSSWSPTGRKR
jgi:anti-anti-sigma regulatory factor